MAADGDERMRIIDAAYRCLLARDGATVSVTAILAEAGLSTRAFYRHFESKDSLLLALFRRDSDRLRAEARARWRAVRRGAYPPWCAVFAVRPVLALALPTSWRRRVRRLLRGPDPA